MKIKIEKIIEFGVGYGTFAEKVINLFKPSLYVGVEINEEVRLKIPKMIELLILDLNNDRIPYPDEYFDLGIACEVIEHLANPDNMIKLDETYDVIFIFSKYSIERNAAYYDKHIINNFIYKIKGKEANILLNSDNVIMLQK
jgi:hypothetical protein